MDKGGLIYTYYNSARRSSNLQVASFSFIFFFHFDLSEAYLMTPRFQRGTIHKQFSFNISLSDHNYLHNRLF